MNIVKKVTFIIPLFSLLFSFGFAQENEKKIEEDLDKRIVQINSMYRKSLLSELQKPENLGKIPYKIRPRTLLVRGDFDVEGPKTQKFILFLLQNKNIEVARRTLNYVLEIFMCQFYRDCYELKFDSKEIPNAGRSSSDEQKEQDILAVFGRQIKEEILRIMLNIYLCQNETEKGITYSHDKEVLGLIFTQIVIDLYRVKHSGWKFEKKRRLLIAILKRGEKRLISAFRELDRELSLPLLEEDITHLMDSLVIFIERPHSFPWRRAVKGFFYTGLIGLNIYAIYWIIKHNPFKEDSSWSRFIDSFRERYLTGSDEEASVDRFLRLVSGRMENREPMLSVGLENQDRELLLGFMQQINTLAEGGIRIRRGRRLIANLEIGAENGLPDMGEVRDRVIRPEESDLEESDPEESDLEESDPEGSDLEDVGYLFAGGKWNPVNWFF